MKPFCKTFNNNIYGQIVLILKPTEELGDEGPEVRVYCYLGGVFQSFSMGFKDDSEASWTLARRLFDYLDAVEAVKLVDRVARTLGVALGQQGECGHA